MLVPGLEKLLLSEIISGDDVDCSRLHDLLCQCAQAMLDKYRQKKNPSEKLWAKTRAVQVMLDELNKVPKSSLATHDTILAALKSHAVALQGYEHLLSEKGNNYALMEQTKSFLRKHGDAPASLLQYHDLKNKVLVPDKTLIPEQKEAMTEAISELSAKKGLTLKILEAIKSIPRTSGLVLGKLHKAGLLEPDWCTRVLKHEHSYIAAEALVQLHRKDLLTSDVCDKVLENSNPCRAAKAILEPTESVSESADQMPGFHMSLHNGHASAVAAFIQGSSKAIVGLHLPEPAKVDILRKLLVSKRLDGTPGLYMALYNGHAEAISTFIQGVAAVIARLSLPKKEKADLLCELLASKAINGKPGFYMALQNGNSDAISAFIQATALAMTTFSESKEEGAELLYGLFHDMERANTPDFLLALEQGGPEVNKAFTEGIDLLPLSVEQKETLKHPTPG